jgi:hypothetical protein
MDYHPTVSIARITTDGELMPNSEAFSTDDALDIHSLAEIIRINRLHGSLDNLSMDLTTMNSPDEFLS